MFPAAAGGVTAAGLILLGFHGTSSVGSVKVPGAVPPQDTRALQVTAARHSRKALLRRSLPLRQQTRDRKVAATAAEKVPATLQFRRAAPQHARGLRLGRRANSRACNTHPVQTRNPPKRPKGGSPLHSPVRAI